MTTDAPFRPALRVVTIGAGYFSRFHVEAWVRNPDTEFTGLCDTVPGKAEAALAATQSTATAFEDVAEMLAVSNPDIVDIAAPPAAHFTLLQQAIASNARAIICQKPFCVDLEQAREAVKLAQSADKLVVVHENFRFQPWYRVIKQRIDDGSIGQLYQITFRLRPGDGQGEDAYLSRQPYFQTMGRFLMHETGVHWIDTFRYLMGEPEAVYADLRRLNPAIAGEDSGMFIYRYADGRRAVFDGNRLVDHAADDLRLTMGECLVEGSEGVIGLDGYGRLWVRARGAKEPEEIALSYSPGMFGGDCVYALQKHVIDHLVHGQPVENDAASYLRNIEIEHLVYESARNACAMRIDRPLE